MSEAHVPLRSLGFNPGLDVSGLSLLVTIDEAGGTVAIDFSKFGTRVFNIQGVDNDVSKDVFMTLRGPDGTDVLLVHVPPQTFIRKGKTLTAADTKDQEGRIMNNIVVKGEKSESGQTATVFGKMTAKTTKQALTLALTEPGVDLSKLVSRPGSGRSRVGDQAVTHAVKIKRTAKGLSFR